MTKPYQPRFQRNLVLRVLTLTLAAGSAGLALNAVPAIAKDKTPAGPTFSAKFGPLYNDLGLKLQKDKARPDILAAQQKVKAASDGAAQNAAQAELEAMVAPEVAQLPTVMAAASTPDDQYGAGQLQLELGMIAMDTPMERKALEAMIASGKAPPADIGRFQSYIGKFAYRAGEYPAAISAFEAATAAGYTDADINIVLADSYLRNKQPDKGLPALQHAVDVQKASGQPVPAEWYLSGVVAAYNAKAVGPALSFGAGLIEAQPTQKNWGLLIQVVQRVGGFTPQDELDLLRLMARTHSFAQKEDLLEYIQDADARRLPGEVLDVIAAGQAAGLLNASDPAIAEAKSIASARVTADRASLAGLERDARAPGANAATAAGAGDAALSYGQGADAVAMYQIALAKPGVETERVLTRLGIAQIDTADYAGARATFAKITGPRQSLAQLWSIYAAQKAAGK